MLFNVTLGGISEISQQQANSIGEALRDSLNEPNASDISVSSNTIVHDDMLTLIISVYPSADSASATLQSELEALGSSNILADNLRSADIQVTSVTVNSVVPQAASQSIQRAPVTGSSLAGMMLTGLLKARTCSDCKATNRVKALRSPGLSLTVAYALGQHTHSMVLLKHLAVCRDSCCDYCGTDIGGSSGGVWR